MICKTQSDLAHVLGVHRRTLAEYQQQGCPIVKATKGGYLVAPTVWWFSRLQMRKQIESFIKASRMPEMIEESLTQILADHEKSWPLWIRQEFSK